MTISGWEFILGPFPSSEGRKLLINTLHQKSLNLALQGYPSLKTPPTKKALSVESWKSKSVPMQIQNSKDEQPCGQPPMDGRSRSGWW